VLLSVFHFLPRSHQGPPQPPPAGWKWPGAGVIAGLALMTAGCVQYQARPLHPEQTARLLEGRSLKDPALRTFLEASLGHPTPQWPLPAWSAEELSLAAVFLNPELATLRAQQAVADAGIQTAAGRPNPTLGLQGGYNFDAGHTGITPWIPGTTFDLPIETAGKRSRRRERAGHLAQVARWNLAAAAWTVRASIQVALLETLAAERKGTLLSETLECSDRMGRILEQRFEAGAATTLEVNTARVNRLRLSAEVADARRATM
jgi:outer membrane protein TolC